MSNTIVLGLGSSQGNRLTNMRQALAKLKATAGLRVLNVAPVYISEALLPENAPVEWQTYYLNSAVHCETSLMPHDLLAAIKKIEQEIGRKPAERWAPRVIDIDILSYADQVIREASLVIPHREIINRPFVLWPLLDLKPNLQTIEFEKVLAEWGDRFSGTAPFNTRQIAQQLVGPELVGIINLTPDSFAGDGLEKNYAQAIAQAKQLFAEGAVVLDIGAEATNPVTAKAITSKQECQRLLPFLRELQTVWQPDEFQPLISIDTYHADTVAQALEYKIDWINDESTTEMADIVNLLKDTDKKYLFMHNLGIPVIRGKVLSEYCDPVKEILLWGQLKLKQLHSLGIRPEQLIFDPGIGFGNSPTQALELLRRIAEFSELKLPVFIGHSRKSFLNQFTNKPFAQRDPETMVITGYLATQPVNYLRVHNVVLNNQAIKIAQSLLPLQKMLIKETQDEALGV